MAVYGWISTVAQFVRTYTCTQVNFTSVDKTEAMYERPRVNVKVEGGSPSTFRRDTPYITSILFTHVKLRDGGNLPYMLLEAP